MFVRRNIPWLWTLYYCWPSLTYFLLVAVVVHFFREQLLYVGLLIPKEPVTITATALAIFLGFKNGQAYDRWWEARKIWGLAVNYSRAWARQVLTLMSCPESEKAELREMQEELIRRHAAFVYAMRIYLRTTKSYPQEVTTRKELVVMRNDYSECHRLLEQQEFESFISADHPPEYLLRRQGETLREARDKGWISEYALIHLDQTLVEFNNVQGRAERIKKTPFPRPYSFFQRVIVLVLGTLMPLSFEREMGWIMIPMSFMVSFVFLALDLIGSRIEDPFENRADDVPMSAISRTIERNLFEALGHDDLPPSIEPEHGILL